MPIDHWMVFGTFAQKNYFTYPNKNTYKGVIINANMVAHAPGGMAGFLLENTKDQTYIIDPQTHAFQHAIRHIQTEKSDENGNSILEVKSSIEKLANSYGGCIQKNVGIKRLTHEMIGPQNELEEVTKNCLDFQRKALQSKMNDAVESKYFIDDEGEIIDTEEYFSPYGLVAPYFYLNEANNNDWLPINVLSIALAINYLQDGEKLFAEVVLSQGLLLDSNFISQIENELNNAFDGLPIDRRGIMIWIDDLNEHDTSEHILSGLKNLSIAMKRISSEVINMHASYFSMLSAKKHPSFTGIAHGPEFGESRAVVPVGGGIPVAKYYIPEMYDRFKFKDAVRIFQSAGWLVDANTFHSMICNCSECKDVILDNVSNFILFGETKTSGKREYSSPDSKRRSLKHYLQRKEIEFQNINSMTIEELLEKLQQDKSKYENVGEECSYHQIWIELLS